MRMLVVFLAVFVFADPVAAQSWQEYSYPDYSFRITFPAAPQIETTTYRVSDHTAVEAHVYSVRRDDAVFKVTVAELADPGLKEKAVIDHAIKTLSEGGEVQVNLPHRINRVFGRQLSILKPDGSRAAIALFDYNGRLYQIEGRSLPTGNDATADSIRFVQSLIFTGAGSNRSAEEIQAAARAACSGLGEARAAGNSSTGDPVDVRRADIRCRRQQSFVALVSSLNSGDLSGAQQAYSTLSQLQGAGRPPFPNNGPLAQAMSRIGQALQNGDLTGAQQALSSLPRVRAVTREP